MMCISEKCKKNRSDDIFRDAQIKYSVNIRKEIKDFVAVNSGGYPLKNVITANDEKYEVRAFLSLDPEDKNYCIKKPLDYFLEKTGGKIVPVGLDSGDNYYCVNNETGKIYYWSAAADQYYCIAQSIDDFIKLFI